MTKLRASYVFEPTFTYAYKSYSGTILPYVCGSNVATWHFLLKMNLTYLKWHHKHCTSFENCEDEIFLTQAKDFTINDARQSEKTYWYIWLEHWAGPYTSSFRITLILVWAYTPARTGRNICMCNRRLHIAVYELEMNIREMHITSWIRVNNSTYQSPWCLIRCMAISTMLTSPVFSGQPHVFDTVTQVDFTSLQISFLF